MCGREECLKKFGGGLLRMNNPHPTLSQVGEGLSNLALPLVGEELWNLASSPSGSGNYGPFKALSHLWERVG